jgi:hypothetical protein
MTEFATYARFHAPQDAESLVTLLDIHKIPFNIEHEVNQLDPLIIGNSLDPMFVVNIPADKFEEVNKLLRSTIDETERETERVSDDLLMGYEPERLATSYIVGGYLLSGFPLIGIFVSITLLNSKRRLKNGDNIPLYDRHTRNHAKVMMAISIFLTVYIVLRKIHLLEIFFYNPF